MRGKFHNWKIFEQTQLFNRLSHSVIPWMYSIWLFDTSLTRLELFQSDNKIVSNISKPLSILINQLHESISNKLHKCKERERDKHRGRPFRIYIRYNNWRLDAIQLIQNKRKHLTCFNSTQDYKTPKAFEFSDLYKKNHSFNNAEGNPFSQVFNPCTIEKKKKNNHIKKPSSQDQILRFLRNMPHRSSCEVIISLVSTHLWAGQIKCHLDHKKNS